MCQKARENKSDYPLFLLLPLLVLKLHPQGSATPISTPLAVERGLIISIHSLKLRSVYSTTAHSSGTRIRAIPRIRTIPPPGSAPSPPRIRTIPLAQGISENVAQADSLGTSDQADSLGISDQGGFLGISDLGGFLGTSDLGGPGLDRPPPGEASPCA